MQTHSTKYTGGISLLQMQTLLTLLTAHEEAFCTAPVDTYMPTCIRHLGTCFFQDFARQLSLSALKGG